VSKFLTAHQYN